MRNSFVDFMGDLRAQTKGKARHFKSTMYGAEVCKKSFEDKQVPNLKMHGESWDVNHMQAFLKDPSWSTLPTQKTASSSQLLHRESRFGTGVPLTHVP
jgi:hypothetical protein